MQLATIKEGNLTTWAADINAAHAEAMLHAGKAIDYAKQAGLLLMKVKQKLPHGEFGGWLESNCQVSARQAQRYIAAAQGKPLPIRAITSNTTPMSYLPDAEAEPEYTHLDAAHDQISGLKDSIARLLRGEITEEDRANARQYVADMKAHISTLEATIRAVTTSRDTYAMECVEFRKQIVRQAREYERLTA